MIDGESSKAERLQKVFIWRYYCSYSDAYLIKSDLFTLKESKLSIRLCACSSFRGLVAHVVAL